MAPNRRLQVDTELESLGFRPAASPTRDGYRAPSAQNDLAQLAGALSSIAPELSRFAAVQQDIDDEETIRAAEQQAAEDLEALQEAETTFSEARRQGLIQEHQDPVFRARYQELVGRSLGERAMGDWQAHKAETLSEAVTLEEFDQSFNEFYDAWTDENLGESREEPALATAYRQTVQQGVLQDRRSWARSAGQELVAKSDETFYSTVFQGVSNRLSAGESPEDLAQYISDELEAHQALAGDTPGARRRINKSAVRAALDSATRMALNSDVPGRPMAVLDALRQVPAGPGSTLGSTSWAQDLLFQAESRILQNIRGREALHAQAQEARVDAVYETALQDLLDNGLNADLHQYSDQLTEMGAVGGSAIQSLIATQNSMLNAAERSDPETERDLLDRIYADPTNRDQHINSLRAALNDGRLSRGSFVSLAGQVQSAFGSATSGDSVFDDPIYTQIRAGFNRLFGSDIQMDTSTAQARLQGMAHFNRVWMQWSQANPDATPEEKQDFLLQQSDVISKFYTEGLQVFTGTPVRRMRWNEEPLVSDAVYRQLVGVFQDGRPMPMRQYATDFYRFLANEGFGPEDTSDILLFLEQQRQFFDSPSDTGN